MPGWRDVLDGLAHAGQAERRAAAAEHRAGDAEMRALAAEMRADRAEVRADRADRRVEDAEARAARAERDTETDRTIVLLQWQHTGVAVFLGLALTAWVGALALPEGTAERWLVDVSASVLTLALFSLLYRAATRRGERVVLALLAVVLIASTVWRLVDAI